MCIFCWFPCMIGASFWQASAQPGNAQALPMFCTQVCDPLCFDILCSSNLAFHSKRWDPDLQQGKLALVQGSQPNFTALDTVTLGNWSLHWLTLSCSHRTGSISAKREGLELRTWAFSSLFVSHVKRSWSVWWQSSWGEFCLSLNVNF